MILALLALFSQALPTLPPSLPLSLDDPRSSRSRPQLDRPSLLASFQFSLWIRVDSNLLFLVLVLVLLLFLFPLLLFLFSLLVLFLVLLVLLLLFLLLPHHSRRCSHWGVK